MNASDRIILALDLPGEREALEWAARFKGRVGMFKVGLRLFTRCGPAIVSRIASEHGPVFLDLKYHDIPHTVAAAVTEAAGLGVSMLTVHASGGLAMLRAASEAASEAARRQSQQKDRRAVSDAAGASDGPGPGNAASGADPGSGGTATSGGNAAYGGDAASTGPTGPARSEASSTRGAPARVRVLAVTVLTSLGHEELAAAGVVRSMADQVSSLAESAWIAGCDGFVASPLEAALLREKLGASPVIVTPGIVGSPGTELEFAL